MSTRLLQDLENRAVQAKDDNERLHVRAERAGALASLGRIQEAKREIAELRKLNAQYTPTLAAWILFAEGMAEHFEGLRPQARDRFSRAYAIAVSVGDRRLRGLSVAWLAAWEIRAGVPELAARQAAEALTTGIKSDHATLGRAYLVLAGCLSMAGARVDSMRFFALARSHAVDAGDIALQSVILHNVATYGLNRLTIEDAFGLVSTEDSTRIQMELESMASLEDGIGLTTLKAGTGLVIAQLHVCRQRWSDALSLLTTHLEAALDQGHRHWHARGLADMSLCLSKLGDAKAAMEMAARAIEKISAQSDFDDLAITHARLASTFQEIGDSATAKQHKAIADLNLEAFRKGQRELLAVVDEVLGTFGEKRTDLIP